MSHSRTYSSIHRELVGKPGQTLVFPTPKPDTAHSGACSNSLSLCNLGQCWPKDWWDRDSLRVPRCQPCRIGTNHGPLCLLAMPLKAHLPHCCGLLFTYMLILCEMSSGSSDTFLLRTQYIMKKLVQSPAIHMKQKLFLVLYLQVSKINDNKFTSQTWGLQDPHLGRKACSFNLFSYLRLCIFFYTLGT